MIWSQEPGLFSAAGSAGLRQGCGCTSAMLVGTVAAAVLWFGFDVAWGWAVAAWPGAYVLGALVGRRAGRLVLLRMEFDPAEIRLVGAEATHTVRVADVIGIEVRHSSDPPELRRTSVELTYATATGTVTVGVTNAYDATVGTSLAGLLGPAVRIRESHPVDGP